jgi:hypothetical protein
MSRVWASIGIAGMMTPTADPVVIGGMGPVGGGGGGSAKWVNIDEGNHT